MVFFVVRHILCASKIIMTVVPRFVHNVPSDVSHFGRVTRGGVLGPIDRGYTIVTASRPYRWRRENTPAMISAIQTRLMDIHITVFSLHSTEYFSDIQDVMTADPFCYKAQSNKSRSDYQDIENNH